MNTNIPEKLLKNTPVDRPMEIMRLLDSARYPKLTFQVSVRWLCSSPIVLSSKMAGEYKNNVMHEGSAGRKLLGLNNVRTAASRKDDFCGV
jgi:hypothetical protein